MLNRFCRLVPVASLTLLSYAASAGDFEVDGVALRGYDPVAYFVSSFTRTTRGETDVAFAYDPSSNARQPAYGLLNTEISARIAAADLEIRVWGRNLTDTRYFLRAFEATAHRRHAR